MQFIFLLGLIKLLISLQEQSSEETVRGEAVRNSDVHVLTTQDGVIYKSGRVVVPRVLRKEFLQCLHASHQGLDATMRRAQDVLYWPCMLEDI